MGAGGAPDDPLADERPRTQLDLVNADGDIDRAERPLDPLETLGPATAATPHPAGRRGGAGLSPRQHTRDTGGGRGATTAAAKTFLFPGDRQCGFCIRA